MIWQLMKRDFATRGAAVLALALPVAMLASRFFEANGTAFRAAAVGGVAGYCVVAFVVGVDLSLHGLPYLSALPIPGREYWISRVLSGFALVWLPALAALVWGASAFPLLLIAAVCTLLALQIEFLGLRPIGKTRRFRTAVLQVVLFPALALLLFPSWRKQGFALPHPELALAACGVLAAVILARGWAMAPGAFQTAAPGSAPTRWPQLRTLPRGSWAPLLDSTFHARSMLITAVFALSFPAGMPVLAAIPQSNMRGQCRWLLSLPFSPRKLFALIAVPIALLVAVSFYVALFYHGWQNLGLKADLVELASMLAMTFLVLFLTGLPAWRRLSKLPPWLLWAPFFLAFAAAPVALSHPDIFLRLTAALPDKVWALASLLGAAVLATYKLAEQVFVEREYRALLVERPPRTK